MPPLLSDEESQGSDTEIPFRSKNEEAAEEEEEEEENEENEEGEDGEEPDEYVVEKILSHAFNDKGVCLYEVKWLGYEKKSDRTWEPEDNLSGAVEVLNEYFDSIGGRPQLGQKPRKRGRKKSSAVESDSATPSAPTKRIKKEKEWSPPPGSWENDVQQIETVDENNNSETGEKERWAFVLWKNGSRTQHPLDMIYRKCPQKMLIYYEQHLVFTHRIKDEDEIVDQNGEIKPVLSA